MSNNNPFEFFQSLMNQEAFTKSMQGTPNIDMSSFSASMKNTAETLSSTNQMVSENMQSIFKRGSEALQKNTTEMYNTMKDAVSAGDITQISACQQKYLQSTLDTNFNNAKEVIDMSTKSLLEALNVMQTGIKENADKAFVKPKNK
jgi:phasin family protein